MGVGEMMFSLTLGTSWLSSLPKWCLSVVKREQRAWGDEWCKACVQPFSCIQWMPLHAARQVIAMGLSYPPKNICFHVPDKHLGGSLLGALFSGALCHLLCVYGVNASEDFSQRDALGCCPWRVNLAGRSAAPCCAEPEQDLIEAAFFWGWWVLFMASIRALMIAGRPPFPIGGKK